MAVITEQVWKRRENFLDDREVFVAEKQKGLDKMRAADLKEIEREENKAKENETQGMETEMKATVESARWLEQFKSGLENNLVVKLEAK